MKRLSVGQATLLAALVILLILTAVWAISVWNATGEAVMDKHGWIALGLGSFFSLVIGCGLMALMFFSITLPAKPPMRNFRPLRSAGDIYPALEKGTIDATEWVGPYDGE